MRRIKRALLLGALMFIPLGIVGGAAVAQTSGVSYQQKRPYSWYYPYSYRYYTPHKESGSNQCYWVYTNGSYVYVCS